MPKAPWNSGHRQQLAKASPLAVLLCLWLGYAKPPVYGQTFASAQQGASASTTTSIMPISGALAGASKQSPKVNRGNKGAKPTAEGIKKNRSPNAKGTDEVAEDPLKGRSPDNNLAQPKMDDPAPPAPAANADHLTLDQQIDAFLVTLNQIKCPQSGHDSCEAKEQATAQLNTLKQTLLGTKPQSTPIDEAIAALKPWSPLLSMAALVVSLLGLIVLIYSRFGRRPHGVPDSEEQDRILAKLTELSREVERLKSPDNSTWKATPAPVRRDAKFSAQPNEFGSAKASSAMRPKAAIFSAAPPTVEALAPVSGEPSSLAPPPTPPLDPNRPTGNPLRDYNHARTMGGQEGVVWFIDNYQPFGLSCINLDDLRRDPDTVLKFEQSTTGVFLALERSGSIMAFPAINRDYLAARSSLDGVFQYPAESGAFQLTQPAELQRKGDYWELLKRGEFRDA